MKKMRIPVLLLGVAAFLAGCGETQAEKVTEESGNVLVSTAKSTSEHVDRMVQFSANIEPNQQNAISSGTAGRINKIYVKVGDRVQRGQLLVEMDQTQYAQNKVELANAELALGRFKSAYEAGGISKHEVDQVEAQVKVLKEADRFLKENSELRSPINGVVTERNYDPGDQVTAPKLNVLQVMEVGTVKVTMNVSEQYFNDVKLGMPVEVAVDILDGQTFTGKVSLIYPTIDPLTRTFKIEVAIPNPKGTLRPGMFSRASINFGAADAVIVPDLAVQKQMGSNEKYVIVVEGDSVARRRTVEPGRRLGDKIVIESGLESGETVAVTGFTKLHEGVKVEVKNGK